MQVQRVESCCALLEGILARQRELLSRAANLVVEEASVDAAISPRKGLPDAPHFVEDSEKRAPHSASSCAEDRVGGVAPSLGVIDQAFLFAMVWGLGGGLTADPALAFDVYVRDLVQVCTRRSCRGSQLGTTTKLSCSSWDACVRFCCFSFPCYRHPPRFELRPNVVPG